MVNLHVPIAVSIAVSRSSGSQYIYPILDHRVCSLTPPALSISSNRVYDMSDSVQQILNDAQLAPIMAELQKDDDDDKKICMLVRQATERLRAMGFVQKLRIPPKSIGIHPSNRNEYGFVADEVLDLGEGLCSIGIDETATMQAAAFGESPSKKIDAYTRGICNAQPNLATFPMGTVLGGSVACTQTNQFFCCIIDEVSINEFRKIESGVDKRVSTMFGNVQSIVGCR